MITIRNLNDIRRMDDSLAKAAMEARAILCHDNDEDMMSEIEDGFNGPLGGDWYIFEEGDNPRRLLFDDGYTVIDLLSEEWNWSDEATLEDGCYFVFWGTNNAGGPCLFVADEPWLPDELRERLDELVAAHNV